MGTISFQKKSPYTVHCRSSYDLLKYSLFSLQLRKIDCLQDNFRLTEVYLQDNMLLDIVGSLRHLTGLEVLMLQGNQLKQLTDVVHELRKMQRLRVLSTPNIGAIIEYPSTFETTFKGRNTNQLDACSKISLNIMLKVYIVCTCCLLSNLLNGIF